MNQEKVWQELVELPPDAQQMVADFVDFLHTKYTQPPVTVSHSRVPLQDEPFIGMWRERKDLADSSHWVRQLRAAEWGPTSD